MITKMVSGTDGSTYLHTHLGADAQEIADALRPYIGHMVVFYPPNMYGHINPQKATYGWLRGVEGTRVRFYVPALDYEGDADAFDAFGSYCTRIEAKREDDK